MGGERGMRDIAVMKSEENGGVDEEEKGSIGYTSEAALVNERYHEIKDERCYFSCEYG